MPISSSAQELVELLRQKGIKHEAVLAAIAKTPRHVFVSPEMQSKAYWDTPLPISHEQTISQPFIVARMTELLLGEKSLQNVLEIGTGSGYQAAVLSSLAEQVFTIERIEKLYDQANQRIKQLNFTNIHTKFGDGFEGWPEQAPFDGIIVTARIQKVPEKLLAQLAEGGRMIIPVGDAYQQQLQLITRQGDKFFTEHLDSVLFVPLLPGTL